MRREAAVDVVAGHLLVAADRREAPRAQLAFAAGQHGGHDDRLAEPRLPAGSGERDAPAHLVAERERQRPVRAHAVVEIPEVGVTDAAAGDRDDDLARARLERDRRAHERRVRRGHLPAVSFDAHACRPSRVAPSPQRSGPGGRFAVTAELWYRNTDLSR